MAGAQESRDNILVPLQPLKRVRVQTQAPNLVPVEHHTINLHTLLDMPYELLTQVSSYLMPIDLLSLARSNKHCRKAFLSPSFRDIWRTTLRNVPGLPECPPELCEPQYVSLIWSKTCTSCGTEVWRTITAELLVRLCSVCIEEQVCELTRGDALLEVVPTASRIVKWKTPSHWFALRCDIEWASEKMNAKETDNEAYHQWHASRVKDIQRRHAHASLLVAYLNSGYPFPNRLRKQDIVARLTKEGWGPLALCATPRTSEEWTLLVDQPEVLTDRIWAHIYPRIHALLEPNQVYNKKVETERHREERIQILEELVHKYSKRLPPLVHVTMKESGSNKHRLEIDYPPDKSPPPFKLRDEDVHAPFPSMVELLTWPIIRNIVDTDISPREFETSFESIRIDFNRALVDWRTKIEQDLGDIRGAGRDEDIEALTGSGLPLPADGSGLTVPEFLVTFMKPDGTYTTNLFDLPMNLQTVLRACSMFKSGFGRTYPGIVPPAAIWQMEEDWTETRLPDKQWDPCQVAWDAEHSAVAKKMLERLGRADATTAEMRALTFHFVCARCNELEPHFWESLVTHYVEQQVQWKVAQERISVEQGAPPVFNHTHDLGPTSLTPFARLLTSDELDKFMHSRFEGMIPVVCLQCEGLDLETKSFLAVKTRDESPIMRHLREV
ncbi:hypothetical protein FRC07_006513, partial [Ceratobasidium sp. 392]